jgi:hypothetical protein
MRHHHLLIPLLLSSALVTGCYEVQKEVYVVNRVNRKAPPKPRPQPVQVHKSTVVNHVVTQKHVTHVHQPAKTYQAPAAYYHPQRVHAAQAVAPARQVTYQAPSYPAPSPVPAAAGSLREAAPLNAQAASAGALPQGAGMDTLENNSVRPQPALYGQDSSMATSMPASPDETPVSVSMPEPSAPPLGEELQASQPVTQGVAGGEDPQPLLSESLEEGPVSPYPPAIAEEESHPVVPDVNEVPTLQPVIAGNDLGHTPSNPLEEEPQEDPVPMATAREDSLEESSSGMDDSFGGGGAGGPVAEAY